MDESRATKDLAGILDSLEQRIVDLDELSADPARPAPDGDLSAAVPGSPEPPD